jgi:hypothetical protein
VPPVQVGVLAGKKIVGKKGVASEDVAGGKAVTGGRDLCGRGTRQPKKNCDEESCLTQDLRTPLTASTAGILVFNRIAHRFEI